jgi:hypothetical protein
MKKTALILLIIVALAVIGFFWLRSSLDGMVQSAIVKYGSAMTGASVTVQAVEIKATSGKGLIRGLVVGNPNGFKTPHAIKADLIEVEVDVSTLTKNVIVIKKITVLAPDVTYEKGDGLTNVDAIKKNITQYLGPGKSSEGGVKLIVQEFTVRDAKAQASAAWLNGKTVAIPLPNLQLHNLGQAQGGLTPGELGQEIATAVQTKLTAAFSFDSLLKSTGRALDKTGKAIKGLFQ